MSSQYGEHVQILKYFNGDIGRFLDIGAHDGMTYSNTRPLHYAGWSGVCVEPSPASFFYLMQNYQDIENVKLVNAGIVPAHHGFSRFMPFWVNSDCRSADAMSTYVRGHREKFADHPFREILIPAVTIPELLEAVGTNFDFINIDVEGLNLEILNAVLGAGVFPRCLCVECDPWEAVPSMGQIMARMDLTVRERIGGNLVGFRR